MTMAIVVLWCTISTVDVAVSEHGLSNSCVSNVRKTPRVSALSDTAPSRLPATDPRSSPSAAQASVP